jgi:CIC family chloride channel protein
MPERMLTRLLPVLSVAGVGRRIVLGFLVGIVAGLGAIVFNLACSAGSWFFLDSIAGYRPETPAGEHHFLGHTETPLRIWLLPLCAAVGGLLSGLIVARFAPEASGHGTDAAIDAYHRKDGRISAKVPLVKIIASALTIGSGGSGGREGPIAQIGCCSPPAWVLASAASSTRRWPGRCSRPRSSTPRRSSSRTR